MVTWKGVSEARRLPWLMIEAITAAIQGYMDNVTPFPNQVRQVLVDRVMGGVEKNQVKLPEKSRTALGEEIRQIEAELSEQAKSSAFKLDKKQLWVHFLKNQGLSLSLMMSEVNAYSGVYFAYENFLIQCIKVEKNLSNLRTNGLLTQLRSLVGKDVANQYWNSHHVKMARLIRHAIVHNGRKITPELESFRGNLELESDEIVIMPSQTTKLYNLLKERAFTLTDTLVKLSGRATMG